MKRCTLCTARVVKAVPGGVLCQRHKDQHADYRQRNRAVLREKNRERFGYQPWRPGSAGRPPLEQR